MKKYITSILLIGIVFCNSFKTFTTDENTQTSLSIQKQAATKIDRNWHDIQKSNPELVQIADQHIAQKPLLKRLGYPTNAYKRTECYCNDLRRKLIMAQSPDISTINPHYDRYQKLLQDNNISQLLQEAIKNASAQEKKDELGILQDNFTFLKNLPDAELNLYKNELQTIGEQLDSTIQELILGETIITKLQQGELTPHQLNKFLQHKQNRDIDTQDLKNYALCVASYPSLQDRK